MNPESGRLRLPHRAPSPRNKPPVTGYQDVADHVGITQKAGKAMPVGQLDFGFGSVDYRFVERDREADGGVLNLIVIGIIAHQPAK